MLQMALQDCHGVVHHVTLLDSTSAFEMSMVTTTFRFF